MKILLVHNHYSTDAPSGENSVFESEFQLLKSKGHQIETFEKFNDEINTGSALDSILLGMKVPWNTKSLRQIRSLCEKFKPDVIHTHNTFPLISPSIFNFQGAHAHVFTLHNYRLFCAAGTPLRNGETCTKCIDEKRSTAAIKYDCYRNNKLATLPVAASIEIHRLMKTWQTKVDLFIAMTAFQKKLLTRAGLPENKIAIKPNFVTSPVEIIPFDQRTNDVIFVGRLTDEKGVQDLIDAWNIWGLNAPKLSIVGDGAERDRYNNTSHNNPRVKFLGMKTKKETMHLISNSKLLILPSRTYETFGLVIAEAFSQKVAVAVSDVGSLQNIAAEGCVARFRARSPIDLHQQISKVWNNSELLEKCGLRGHTKYMNEYSAEYNYKKLISLYESAIDNRMKLKS